MIFYYHRLNRYSFNALAAAIDGEPELTELPIRRALNPEDLRAACAATLGSSERAIVALSVLTVQRSEVRQLVAQLRMDHGTRPLIIAGGPQVTADPQEALEWGIDIVCRGEAEEAFPIVLKRLASGAALDHVAGIAFRTEGEIIINPPAQPVDIDAFPSFSPKRAMYGPIEITRGCPFACSFCQTSHIFGVRPRHRSVDNIVRQAATLRSRNRTVVRLLSPNAFSYGSPDGRQLNLPAIAQLLAALRETVAAGGRIIFGHFPSEVRPEHVTRETLELLRRYADNDEIVIGAQSGSPRVLEACRRAHSVESILSATALARRFGYKVIVDFIFGLPGENSQDEHDTVTVMKELARMGSRVHAHLFAPLPQTAFAAKSPGRISPGIISALEQLRQRRALYSQAGEVCIGSGGS